MEIVMHLRPIIQRVHCNGRDFFYEVIKEKHSDFHRTLSAKIKEGISDNPVLCLLGYLLNK